VGVITCIVGGGPFRGFSRGGFFFCVKLPEMGDTAKGNEHTASVPFIAHFSRFYAGSADGARGCDIGGGEVGGGERGRGERERSVGGGGAIAGRGDLGGGMKAVVSKGRKGKKGKGREERV